MKFISSGDSIDRWSVYQCLVSEQRINGKLYALVKGRWFEITSSLVTQVDAAISAIPEMTISLSPDQPGESEADYNARAASSSPELTLLDKQ